MLVGDIIKSNARLFPNKMAIIDDRLGLTWKQFNDRVNKLARAMLGLGLKKGDRVALLCENCHEYAEFLFAIAKAGLVTVCLNYRLTAAQLIRILNSAEPRAILVQDKFAGLIEPIHSEAKSIDIFVGIGGSHHCHYDYESLLSKYSSDEPNIDVAEQDVYRLQYTTGITGTSKGVLITHKNEIADCMMRTWGATTTRDDVFLLPGPLYAVGLQGMFLAACLVGATQVITTFSAKGWVETVEKNKVTVASLLVATTFRMVRDYLETSDRKYDLSSLRKLHPMGGQHCSGADLKKMLDYFNIPYSNSYKVYGMTEANPTTYLTREDIAAGLSPNATEKERRRLESVGKPLFNCEVRVVDENDNDVTPGQIGEIVVKGDQVMKGYWNNPELTSRALRGGWFHTSDLGTLDEDGYLYFRGRKDFVIKSGGLLVGPEEVEGVIQQHPAVAEAAVIGIPDEKWGQLVKAVVCLKPGQEATEQEIKDYCRRHLADYQVPKSVTFREESLPREIAHGKIDRRGLIETYGREQV